MLICLLLFLSITSVYSFINVFVSKNEMNRTLGINAEMWYMQDGTLNNYSTRFPYRLKDSISQLRFTWNAATENKIRYVLGVDSSDSEVVPRLLVPYKGYLPRTYEEFAVEYRCAGSRAGQFYVTLTIEFAWPEGNWTTLRLMQEKMCGFKGRGPHHSSQDFEDNSQDSLSTSEVFYIIMGAGVTFLALTIIFLLLYFRHSSKSEGDAILPRKNKRSFRSSFHQPFLTSTPTKSTSSIQPLPLPSSPILERPRSIDIKKNLIELYADRNLFQMMNFTEFEGTFGEVKWAIWRQTTEGAAGDIDDEEDGAASDEPVYIKTLKTSATRADFEKFLSDCLQFQGIASHPNLAKISAAASFGRFENPESISDFPLMCYRHAGFGNLKKFLLNCRYGGEGTISKKTASVMSSSSSSTQTLRAHEIVHMGVQVLKALNHLHRHGILHKDVAARNCLVMEQPSSRGHSDRSDRLFVQLCDSALSSDLFPDDYDRVGEWEMPRPIRWMSPEGIKTNVHSSASDMWSLGVVLWELLSCGGRPYGNVETGEVPSLLHSGERLPQPPNCPDQLYEEMVSCWNEGPRDRPSAAKLIASLTQFHRQLEKYV